MNLLLFFVVFCAYLVIAKVVYIGLNFISGNNIDLSIIVYFMCFAFALNSFGVFDK